MLGRYIAITLVGLGGAMLLAPDAPERDARAPQSAPASGVAEPVVAEAPPAQTPTAEEIAVVAEPPRSPAARAPLAPLGSGTRAEAGQAPQAAAPASDAGTSAAFVSAPPGSTRALRDEEQAEEPAPGSDALALRLLGDLADDSILPTLEAPGTVQSVSVGADTLALISLVEAELTAPDTPEDAAPDADTAPLLYVTGSRVNVRSGPSTGFGVISSVAFGDAVELVAETGDGWAEIRIADGSTGFMARRFLEE
ncbi:MAG: SH3 domain-containing protein [Pseudomonadota bacterium]